MNKGGDNSPACVALHTAANGPFGHGLTFTIDRGNDLYVADAAQRAEPLVGCDIGERVERRRQHVPGAAAGQPVAVAGAETRASSISRWPW